MKRLIALLCVLPLLLAGCNWFDGSYQSVTPHTENSIQLDPNNLSPTNLDGLISILVQMVRNGVEDGVIVLDKYDRNLISKDLESAIQRITATDPLAAYAVKSMQYEFGSSAGKLAAAITIEYYHGKAEIRKITTVPSTVQAKEAIGNCLNQCDAGIVLYINNYTDEDFAQYVTDYAGLHPDLVMEHPDVTVNIYPETGNERVLEVKFTYQNSVSSLKNMQQAVAPIFEASVLLGSGSTDEEQKFSQLYALLMSRSSYQLQTSITPTYSLLQYGIGDSKAFANVYGAMCRKANLDCQTVTGTKDGQPWHWNIIRIGKAYYHLDLLGCKQAGAFLPKQSDAMTNYVWDYHAFPYALVSE